MTVLIATGLRREARLMTGPGVTVIAGGGDAARLEHELDMLAGSASIVLSSGLAGALDPTLKVGDVVIGTACLIVGEEQGEGPKASDHALGRKLGKLLADAHVGLVTASDRPLASADQKSALFSGAGALAVDMESHVAAHVAARHGLPFAALRVISDAADATLPPAALAGMRPDGGIAIGAILGSLLHDPAQLPALVRTARDAERAFRVLGRVHDVLRSFGLGSLDPGKLALDMT